MATQENTPAALHRGVVLAFRMLREIKDGNLDEMAHNDQYRNDRPQNNICGRYFAQVADDPLALADFGSVLTDVIGTIFHAGEPILQTMEEHWLDGEPNPTQGIACKRDESLPFHPGSAVHLLRTAIAAFGEFGEPQGDCDWADIEAIIGLAKGQVDQAFGRDDADEQSAFDALDLLTVAEAIMTACDPLPANGRTISPLTCLLRIALEKLDALSEQMDSDGSGGGRAELRQAALAALEGGEAQS